MDNQQETKHYNNEVGSSETICEASNKSFYETPLGFLRTTLWVVHKIKI